MGAKITQEPTFLIRKKACLQARKFSQKMKRASAGTYPSYKQAVKRQKAKPRKNYSSVARTRGAAVTGEMKYFDTSLNDSALAAVTQTWVAGTLKDPDTTINLGAAAVANPSCLCVPTVGAALNQRVGRKILVRKIKLHGTINIAAQAAQAAADSAAKIRIVLVQDCQTNAAPMTGAQLFNDANAAQPTVTINSFQNPNNFGRFRVLKDKMLTISNLNLAGSPSTNDVIQASVRYSFKFAVNFKKPVEVHFNATNGGTVADIVDNSFHIIAATESTPYNPTMSYYARVCYKDV